MESINALAHLYSCFSGAHLWDCFLQNGQLISTTILQTCLKTKTDCRKKKKRLVFTRKYEHKTEKKWRNDVIFFDEFQLQEFVGHQHYVRRPLGNRYNEKYALKTMKKPSQLDELRTTGLYFLDTGTAVNHQKHLVLLKDKLKIHKHIDHCSTVHCWMIVHHALKQINCKNILRREKSLHWNGLATALNLI